MVLFRKSMTRKISLAIGLFILLIFYIYGSYLNIQLRSYFEKECKEHLCKDAKQISTEIEMFLQKQIVIVDQMRTNFDFINIAKEVKDKHKKRDHPLYDRVTDQLKAIKKLDSNISLTYIAIGDANDLITNLYNYDTSDNFDLRKRDWYIETVKAGHTIVTTPYIDTVTGKTTVSIAAPLFEKGKDLGVCSLDVTVDNIYKIMQNYKIGDSGYAILIDKNKNIIYHPSKDILYVSNVIDFHEIFRDQTEDLLSGKSGIFDYNYQGEDKYIAYVPVQNSEWIVGTIIPKAEVFKALNQFIIRNFLLLIATILLVAVLLLFMKKVVFNPIIIISKEIDSFSKNNRDINLPEKFYQRNDEIGILSNGLNFMIKKITQSLSEIEERNQQLFEEIGKRKKIFIRLEMILKLLSGTDEGIFIIDDKFFHVYSNHAFKKILGCDQEELGTIDLTQKILSDKDGMLTELTNTGQTNGEMEYKNKNGESFILFLKMNKVEYDSHDYYTGSIINITKYKETEKIIHYLKHFDPLTKLKNDTYLEEFAKNLISGIHNENFMYALIIINIDNFRLINEAKGFEFGNKVLRAFSEKLQTFEQENDFLAKLGNDQFAILKTNFKTSNELYDFIVTLDHHINSVYYIDSEKMYLNSSIGIGIYPKDAQSYDALLKAAASALNNAKNKKDKSFQFYNTEINNQSVYKYEIQNKLRNALLQDEFLLYYQPQVDMETDRLTGMEALIRWKPSDSQQMIPPSIFIPLAEETHLILPIGEWTLFAACKFGYEIYSKGYGIPVAVNLSGVQFDYPYIIMLIHSILKETNLPPHLLELEITEGMLMKNEQECENILNELQNMGVKVAIDDFGTGYSSLSYLNKFSVDKIKIDRSFIKDIPERDNGLIAKVIIELAEHLGLELIAEGVETQDQVDFLLKNHCKNVQGFLFGKPLAKEEMLKLLESDKRCKIF